MSGKKIATAFLLHSVFLFKVLVSSFLKERRLSIWFHIESGVLHESLTITKK